MDKNVHANRKQEGPRRSYHNLAKKRTEKIESQTSETGGKDGTTCMPTCENLC